MLDERERVNRALAGRICADQIVPYPPGIPVLVPGQLITRKVAEYVANLLRSQKRMEMHGIVHEGYLPCIRVLKPGRREGAQAPLTWAWPASAHDRRFRRHGAGRVR